MLNQLSVVVKNKPGSLRKITGLLTEHNINCLCVSTYDAPDFGIIRMIVDDFEKCHDVLEEKGEVVMKDRVIAIPMKDEPGEMNRILDVIYDANINIDCLYSYISNQLKSAVLIFRAEEAEETEEVLRLRGFAPVNDISEL